VRCESDQYFLEDFLGGSLPLINDRTKRITRSRRMKANIPIINKNVTENNIITILFIDRFCDRDADTDDGSSGDNEFNDGVDDFFGEGADDGLCEDDGLNDGVDDFLVKVLMMV